MFRLVIPVMVLVFATLQPTTVVAEGHGPMFGLATPTLGNGQWSSDTVAMIIGTAEGERYMLREMIAYGINEDLQVSLAFPLDMGGDNLMSPPRTRVGTMMGAFGDVEASALWRFQRVAPSIGTRRESSALVGISVPTEGRRGKVTLGPAINAALVTGYASRTYYWWVGGGYQYYFESDDDRLGDLLYLSGVIGYRPALFRRDYPKPDWRIMIETLFERYGRNRIEGVADANSGGQKLLLGPTILGLYGKWGVEGGAMFPILQDLNGRQPSEHYRAKFVATYWF